MMNVLVCVRVWLDYSSGICVRVLVSRSLKAMLRV